eukprot:CAMPEP_0194498180 /NCGR_PEP_ID=MMETSP0253-20130528/14888_1 /TAXON_ID=2966 /ORGANISM="Noctiluca scintillans" /LENGTH=547 /DNA_ID=CAMNT_0039339785 /DNA_START=86 /DNA_END=1729 /DNA_ORIENTATION=-
MHVQILYSGPSEEFSWLLPMPVQPNVSVGSDVLFTALFEVSRPTFELTIERDANGTCSDSQIACMAMAESEDMDMDDADGGEAEVLEEGTVGPFDFVVVRAADKDPESVFRWLEENNYDQPDESGPLINYYAGMDMVFVALRLSKESTAGEIRPIVLEYDLPADADADLLKMPLACVPIQLSSIAASDNMPVQVYVLGPSRAFPLNFFEVKLDDTLADWVNCGGFFGVASQDCFLNDLRARFASAVADVENHAFMTEYAGSSGILAGQVELDQVDTASLRAKTSALAYLEELAAAEVPDIPLLQSIVDKYVARQSFCASVDGLYMPLSLPTMQQCVDDSQSFDAGGMTDELESEVFEPATEAQAFVDSFPYLTRLYGQLSAIQMTKDPFFGFSSDLPDIPLLHSASAVPICDVGNYGQLVVALNITTAGESFTADVFFCGGGPVPLSSAVVSPAVQLAAFSYDGEESQVLARSADGLFDSVDLAGVIEFMDARVPNQTVPEFSTASTVSASTSAATSTGSTSLYTVDGTVDIRVVGALLPVAVAMFG